MSKLVNVHDKVEHQSPPTRHLLSSVDPPRPITNLLTPFRLLTEEQSGTIRVSIGHVVF